MRKVIILSFIFFVSNINAQYKKFYIEKIDVPNLEIIQIDNRELSTLIHFKYTEITEGVRWITTTEDFYIIDKSTQVKYKLLNSINLPFYPLVHLTKVESKHNFTLEFEKIPDGLREIDIIENSENGFNFYGVKIDWPQDESELMDVKSFVQQTPIDEIGLYYEEGNIVFYRNVNGVTVSVALTGNRNYGKYIQANILIGNKSGRILDFNPNSISAIITKNGKVKEAQILSYNEYMKKVKRKQFWQGVAVAYSESMAASNAAYSSSASSSTSTSRTSSRGYASGNYGNTYGSVYAQSNSYTKVYGTSYSQSYDGAAAYYAQQNANKNISEFNNTQYQIKNKLGEGYVKLNSIPNETEYIGYFNIEYEKMDRLTISIRFNNHDFFFYY